MNSAECQRVAANVAMAARLAHLERRLTGAAGSIEARTGIEKPVASVLPGAPVSCAPLLQGTAGGACGRQPK